jgi:hypothetical protein
MSSTDDSLQPLPLMTFDAVPYWQGCREGRLLLQRCSDCSSRQFYPRALCVCCGGVRLEFVEVSGRGVVHAFTICHRPLSARFAGAPYVVALVDLEEGPRMMTNIVGCPESEVRIGMDVQVSFQHLGEDVVIPVFEPAVSS